MPSPTQTQVKRVSAGCGGGAVDGDPTDAKAFWRSSPPRSTRFGAAARVLAQSISGRRPVAPCVVRRAHTNFGGCAQPATVFAVRSNHPTGRVVVSRKTDAEAEALESKNLGAWEYVEKRGNPPEQTTLAHETQ